MTTMLLGQAVARPEYLFSVVALLLIGLVNRIL